MISKQFYDLRFDDSEYHCNLHPKLLENSVSCLSLNVVSFHLLLTGLMFLFKLSLILINILFKAILKRNTNPKYGSKLRYTLILLSHGFEFANNKSDLSSYFWLFKSIEIDIFLGSWASLKSIRVVTLWSILSNLALLFYSIHSLVYIFLGFYCYYIFYFPKNKRLLSKT